VAETRKCDQCGTAFTPRREHARFCSPRCRLAWNRQQAALPPAEADALDWSITAMRQATDRVQRDHALNRRNGFAVISEAVWWVTMVDATLVRYHQDSYRAALAGLPAGKRQATEETFGGLRYVRNRMGYDDDPAGFIQPAAGRPGQGPAGVRGWTWKAVPEPSLGALTPSGQEWELRRYRAYQARLAGQPVGETFRRAAAFLNLVCQPANLSRSPS
jgi:endogenous inhibitor of DNA gyrase (YacG/DUF329 family)